MKRLNRVGERFGRLLVIELSDIFDYRGVAKWLCLCDCGRVVAVGSGMLQQGQTISCGCVRTDVPVTEAQHLCLKKDYPLFGGRDRQVYRDYIKHALRSYGLRESELRDLMDKQKGCCAICGKSLDHLGKSGCIDHCHTTNIVRGLLCDFCNHGVGSFFDSIDNLNGAIRYLERYL